MTTTREPLELSDAEHEQMERLMAASGIRTKRELVARAVALFGEVTAGRSAVSPPTPLTLEDLIPPAPRRSWWDWWPKPLRGRTADEVLRDMRGEGANHDRTAGEGGAAGGRSASPLPAGE